MARKYRTTKRFRYVPPIIALAGLGLPSTGRAGVRGLSVSEQRESYGCSADRSLGILEFEVKGQLASKSNSRKIVKQEGSLRIIKNSKARKFVEDFGWQYPKVKMPYTGPLKLSCWVYYKDWRPDLDIALLKDCLQLYRMIDNDRQVIEEHSYRGLDKKNPRVRVRIEPLDQWVSAT